MNINKYALVTGASSGIGEEYARQLADRGWSLVLTARSQDLLERLRADLLQRHPLLDVRCMALDLSSPGAPLHLFQQTQASDIEISLLVNNAGFGAFGEFHIIDRERQRQMLDLNIAALVELTHLYLSRMILLPEAVRRAGGIINIASVAGFVPLPYSAVYAATKAFVVSFSHALYEEARQHHVHVMVVNPGSTATNFFKVAGKSPFAHPARMQTTAQVVGESLRAFDRGRPSVTTGLPNRLSVLLTPMIPRSWITALVGKVMRRASVR
ncbi:MAG: SDR family oxidoreductase [Acidobacteriaceae bacterium]